MITKIITQNIKKNGGTKEMGEYKSLSDILKDIDNEYTENDLYNE